MPIPLRSDYFFCSDTGGPKFLKGIPENPRQATENESIGGKQ